MTGQQVLKISKYDIESIAYSKSFTNLIELQADIKATAKKLEIKMPLSYFDAKKIAVYLGQEYKH